MQAYVKRGIPIGNHGRGIYYCDEMRDLQGTIVSVHPYPHRGDPYQWEGGVGGSSWAWRDEWLIIEMPSEVRKARVKLLRAFDDVEVTKPIILDIYEAVRFGVGKKQLVGFSVDRDGSVSYSNDSEDLFNIGKRKKTSLTRYIRRQVGVDVKELKDHELDLLCRHIIRVCHEGAFAVLRGHDIQDAYSQHLGSESCMTGDPRKTAMYAMNPDKVGMLVYTNPYKGSARALLWECDDGVTVVDRIYPNDGGHVEIIRGFADSQGWLYRVSCALPGGTVKLSDGSVREVTLKFGEYIPYMDTFRYGKLCSGVVELSNNKYFGDRCFEGGALPHICSVCGERYPNSGGLRTELGPTCTKCLRRLFSRCDRCDAWKLNTDEVNRVRTVDGKYHWCGRCRNYYAVAKCAKCLNYTRQYDIMPSGAIYCKNCTTRCGKCYNRRLKGRGIKCETCENIKEQKALAKEHGESYRVYADVEPQVVLPSDSTTDIFSIRF